MIQIELQEREEKKEREKKLEAQRKKEEAIAKAEEEARVRTFRTCLPCKKQLSLW